MTEDARHWNVLDFSATKDLGVSDGMGSPVVRDMESAVLDARRVFILPKKTNMSEDVFFLLQRRYKFQVDNEWNSREAATLLVASRISRGSLSAIDALQSVGADLMWNYTQWLAQVGIQAIDGPIALQVALFHMVWGEASNLRFCPEFLCVVFHDMWRRVAKETSKWSVGYDEIVAPYLAKVVQPAYDLVAGFAKSTGDHVDRINYCDFNENFHNGAFVANCLYELESGVAYAAVLNRHRFKKTFLETRSYLQLLRSQFRVIACHAIALHALILCALRNSEVALLGITLAGALAARETAEFVVLGRPLPRTGLSTRLVCVAHCFRLLRRTSHVALLPALLYFWLAGALPAFRVLSCTLLGVTAVNQLARCLGYRLPLPDQHPVLGELFGGEFNTFFRLKNHSAKRASALLWIIACILKLYVSYRLSVKPLVNMTRRLNDASTFDQNDDAFRWYLISWRVGGAKVDTLGVTDARHLSLVVAAWLPHIIFFFLDLEIWYVFLSTLVSAAVGVARGVGVDRDPSRVMRAAKRMPTELFVQDCRARSTRHRSWRHYEGMRSRLEDGECAVYPHNDEEVPVQEEEELALLDTVANDSTRRHVWFAAVWNEMCRTMRVQDLLSDAELAMLLYDAEDTAAEMPFVLEKLQEPPIFAAVETPGAKPETVIKNIEVWRRLRFFVNSLRVVAKQGGFPAIAATFEASTLVPYYDEPVVYDIQELEEPTAAEVTVLELLKTVNPHEFDHLVERFQRDHPEAAPPLSEIERWAAFRGQTLLRTVSGLSFYDRALRVMAALADRLGETRRLLTRGEAAKVMRSPLDHCDEQYGYGILSRVKYTLVLSCQIYGQMKAAPPGSKRAKQAKQIEGIMREFENVRVAYVETSVASDGTTKLYASVLVRWDRRLKRVVQVYRIKLPGNFLVGEAKPCNQNHAIIFTRGEAVQAIDMNQAGYFEEALKLPFFLARNFASSLAEGGPRIAGHREHVFTADVSSLASFMSTQESVFVTSTQRVLDTPLGCRFHYGHPDYFHRLAAMSCGGISKASKGINLSEDIFGGFSFTLRGGKATQSDLVQVGKGKDVGFAQISTFQAKIAMGNAEQSLSRDMFRLGCQSDIVHHFSIFYSSIGHFLLQVGVVAVVLTGAYCKLFIAVRGIQNAVDDLDDDNRRLRQLVYDVVFASQNMGLYLLVLVASVVAIAVEIGFGSSLVRFFEKIVLRGGLLFFAFQVATKAHFVHSTLVYGKATYKGTGRGFDITRADFVSVFSRYFGSHWLLGFELGLALAIFFAGSNYSSSFAFFTNEFIACFFVVALLWTPFLFNPDGFDYMSALKDFEGWANWMGARRAITNLSKANTWQDWWAGSERCIVDRPLSSKFFLVFLPRQRRLLLFWGFAHLAALQSRRARFTFGTTVAMLLCIFISIVLTMVIHFGQAVSMQDAHNSYDNPIRSRVMRYVLFNFSALALIATIVFKVFNLNGLLALLFGSTIFTFQLTDSLLIFSKTYTIPDTSDFTVVRRVHHAFHFLVGIVVFIPVIVVSFFPWFTAFQARCLWNIDFSTRLDTAKVFAHQSLRSRV